MVDEEEALAAAFQAEGSELRAAAVGSHARGRRVRDDPQPPRRAEEGHQVPSLLGLG